MAWMLSVHGSAGWPVASNTGTIPHLLYLNEVLSLRFAIGGKVEPIARG
jgi:hypothetical protein